MIQETDAVVIGAGPVGLFQVFQLGLQGLAAHIIDALPCAGGQCVELYGDKPIYDIPGVPMCTGRELAALLQQQITPFQPQWHLNTQVAALQPQADTGRFHVTTTQGATLSARAVFIAAGVGAFVPKALKLEGIDRFVGTQLHYTRLPATTSLKNQRLVVHGGDDAAVACAVEAATAGQAANVTLLYRRDVFNATPEALAQLQALRNAGRIQVVVGQPTGMDCADERLTALHITTPQDTTLPLPLDVLVVALGVSPRLGPIADWGLAMERKQLVVDTATFATSVPGIYAVGDINTYPGKRKLIVCGFHEATLAAFAAAEALSGKPVALQYTTSSTRLHQLLGVDSAGTVNG